MGETQNNQTLISTQKNATVSDVKPFATSIAGSDQIALSADIKALPAPDKAQSLKSGDKITDKSSVIKKLDVDNPADARRALEKSVSGDSENGCEVTGQNEADHQQIIQQMLTDLGAIKSDQSFKLVEHKDKKGRINTVIEIADQSGKLLRSVDLVQLKNRYEMSLKVAEAARMEQKAQLNYLLLRNGRSDYQSYIEDPQSNNLTSSEVRFIKDGNIILAKDLFQKLNQEKPGMSKTLANLAKHYGKKGAIETYINHETRLGKAAQAAFSERVQKIKAKEASIEFKRQKAEAKGSGLGKMLAGAEKSLLSINKRLSYFGAVTKATTALVAYDWNPLRPVFKHTVGKLWTHEWKNGISGRELAARLEEKLIKDPVTGRGIRTGAITDAKAREASVAGVAWAVRMNLLPQVLSEAGVFINFSVKPAELWSLYRSTNMVRSGVGSVHQFTESMRHAKTPAERAKLVGTMALSAPAFLFAEKICPSALGVNPVLMADIGLMRFVGLAQKYAGERGMEGTASLRVLESVEVGITEAFAFDSALSVGQRLQTYRDTGSLNPMQNLRTETDLVNLYSTHPEYLVGKGGGVFGDLARAEESLALRLSGKSLAESNVSYHQLKQPDGTYAVYTISSTDNKMTMIKQDAKGVSVYSQGKWITPPTTPTPSLEESVADTVVAPETGVNAAKLNIPIEVAALRPVAELATQAIHDYVYYSKDGEKMAFRMDLAAGETIESKVDRLFSGKFDDDTGKSYTGEQVKAMVPNSTDLKAIAGSNGVYEAEIYRDLIQKLTDQAQMNGLLKGDESQNDLDVINHAKSQMVKFLEQKLENGTTIEGETDYDNLFRFLFSSPEVVTETQERAITIGDSGSLSGALNKLGYTYSPNGIDVAGALLFKQDGSNLVQVNWNDKSLDMVRSTDQFVIRLPVTVTKQVEVAMPAILDFKENNKSSFESETPITEPVINSDTLWKTDPVPYLNADRLIYLGVVEGGGSVYEMAVNRFNGVWGGEGKNIDQIVWTNIFTILRDNPDGFEVDRIIDNPSDPAHPNIARLRYEDFRNLQIGWTLVIKDTNNILNLKELPASTVTQPSDRPTATTTPPHGSEPVSTEPIYPEGFTSDGHLNLDNPPKELIRDVDGKIYSGTIDSGQNISMLINSWFGDTGAYSHFLDLWSDHLNNGLDIIVITKDGTQRTFDFKQYGADLGLVHPDDRIIILDPQNVLGVRSVTELVVQPPPPTEAPTTVPETPPTEANTLQDELEVNLRSTIGNLIAQSGSTNSSVVIWDPATGANIDFNADQQFNSDGLSKIAVAMLVLKQVENGQYTLNDPVKFAVRQGGYVPNVGAVLADMLVNSSDTAYRDLTNQLTGVAEFNQEKLDKINAFIKNDLGMTDTTFGTATNPAAVTSTAGDLMHIFQKLQTGFLNAEDTNLLRSYLESSGDNNGLVTSDLEIYGGVQVAENGGLVTRDYNNLQSSMTQVTLGDGRTYYMVVLSGSNLISDISAETLKVFDPELYLNQSRFYGQNAYQILKDPVAQNDYFSHLFFSGTNDSGEPIVRREILPYVSDIADIRNIDHVIIPYADGSAEIKLTDKSTGESTIVFVDRNGNPVGSIDPKIFTENGVTFSDARAEFNSQTTPFASFGFDPMVDQSRLVVSSISDIDGKSSTRDGRLKLVDSIQKSVSDPYDFIIFANSTTGQPLVMYTRPADDRSDGALKHDIQVAIVGNSQGIPTSGEANALQALVQSLTNNPEMSYSITDVVFKTPTNDYSVDQQNIPTNAWFSNISPTLSTYIAHSDLSIDRTLQLALETDSTVPLTALNQKDKVKVDQIYDQVTAFTDIYSKESGRSVTVITQAEFENRVLDKIKSFQLQSDGTPNPSGISVKLDAQTILSLAGVDKNSVSLEGTNFFQSIWLPEGQKPDPEDIARELNIPVEKIVIRQTMGIGTYLIGQKLDQTENPETTYQYSNDKLLYKFKDGTVATKPEAGKEVVTVYPLSHPLSMYGSIDQLVPVGQIIKARVQYFGAGEYLVDVGSTASATDSTVKDAQVYVDPESMRLYGFITNVEKDVNGNDVTKTEFICLPGAKIDFAEMAKLLTIDTSSSDYTRDVVSTRLLDELSKETKSGNTFYVRSGLIIDAPDLYGKGIDASLVLAKDAQGGYKLDSQLRLEYTSVDGKSSYYFDAATHNFITEDENVFLPTQTRLSGFSAVVGDDGNPLHLRGMPVLAKDEIMYAMAPSGLVAVGSVHSQGQMDLTSDLSLVKLYNEWGINNRTSWDSRTFENLPDNTARIVHAVNVSGATRLIETSSGLIDPVTGDKYIIKKEVNDSILHNFADVEPVLDKTTGKSVFTKAGDDKLYTFNNQTGLMEVYSEHNLTTAGQIAADRGWSSLSYNDKIPFTQSLWESLTHIAPLIPDYHAPVNMHQIVDRQTHLPVYSDGTMVYEIDGTGIRTLGTLEGVQKMGLIGYESANGFQTFNSIAETIKKIYNKDELYKIIKDPSLTFAQKLSIIASPILGPDINYWLKEYADHIIRTAPDTKIESVELVKGSSNYVTFDQLPLRLVEAIIASEDAAMMSKSDNQADAVNSSGLVRMILSKAFGGDQSGGSTIAQQLSRGVRLPEANRSEQTINRKVNDWVGAVKLNEEYTVEKILEIYVNSSNYLGQTADHTLSLGILDGAKTVFGKDLSQLTLSETAMLTVIPKSPFGQGPWDEKTAANWAENSYGVLRRMEENGIITQTDMISAQKDVYDRLFPTGNQTDIDYLRSINTIDTQTAEKLVQLSTLYNNIPISDRWTTDADGKDIYLNFYDYVNSHGLQVTYSAKKYSEDGIWQTKFPGLSADKSQVAADVPGLYEPSLAGDGRATGGQFVDALRPGETVLVNSDLQNRFKAMETAGGKEVAFSVIGKDEAGRQIVQDNSGLLWSIGENGLEKLPGVVYNRSDAQGAVQVMPANTNPGVLDTSLNPVDLKNLMVDGIGRYYEKSTDGQTISYVGQTIEFVDGVKTLVNVPELKNPVYTSNSADFIWTTVTNGYRLNGKDNSALSAIINQSVQNLPPQAQTAENIQTLIYSSLNEAMIHQVNPSLDPEKGMFDYHGTTITSPSVIATALNSTGLSATPVELSAGIHGEGLTEFAKIIRDSTDSQKPILVWTNSLQVSDIVKINDSTGNHLDAVSANEYPVVVLKIINREGKDYVIYQDPTSSDIRTVSWETFTKNASSGNTDHYQALILDSYQLSSEAQKYIYDPSAPEHQVEYAMMDKNNPFIWKDAAGQIEQLTTVNPDMQQTVTDIAKQRLNGSGPTSFSGMAMDGNGNIIFDVSLDRDGNPLPFDTAAVQSLTPGSVFKPITSLWALQNGLSSQRELQAGDTYYVDGQPIMRNWTVNEYGSLQYSEGADKQMKLDEALAKSNNVYFYRLLYETEKLFNVKPEDFDNYIQNLGIANGAHNIPGLPNQSGFVGTEAWAEQNYGRQLYNSEQALKAIGEGELRVTPLEMLRLMGMISNNGKMLEPNDVRGNTAVVYGEQMADQKSLDAVKLGLKEVTEKGGTAFASFGTVSGYEVYGKTGTAEIGSDQDPHAWFVGWAEDPKTKEKIIFSFVYENGGHGANVAAPDVRKMLDAYFSDLTAHKAVTTTPAAVQVNPVPTTPQQLPVPLPQQVPENPQFGTDMINKIINSQPIHPESPAAKIPANTDNIDSKDKVDLVKPDGWNPETLKNHDFIDYVATLDGIINTYINNPVDAKFGENAQAADWSSNFNGAKFVDYLRSSLTGAGYGDVVKQDFFNDVLKQTVWLSQLEPNQAMQCVNFMMLAAGPNKLLGQPTDISGLTGYAIDMYQRLVKIGENGGDEISGSYVHHPQNYTDYRSGDLFFMKYGSTGHVGMIVSTYTTTDGKQMMLIADSNRNPEESDPKKLSDGRPRMRWMTYDEFIKEYQCDKDGNKFDDQPVILRTNSSDQINAVK
jgi:membrane peptidoglycan carboxypeptidase